MPPILISPRNEGLEYFELLSMIDARPVRGCEVPGLCKAGLTERVFWIRHDVDHRLDPAECMSKAEAKQDYKATYCFLHTAQYWYSAKFDQAIPRMLRINHDIGLHNNAMTLWLKHKASPLAVIESALARLKRCGADVKMTSAHGDKYCHEKDYCNYEIWYDCPGDYQRGMQKTPKKHLDDYGLIEAYFTRRDAYLTDSGAKWQGQIGDAIPAFEQFEKPLGPVETIELFNRMDTGVLQLLVHPCWWKEAK